MKQENINFTGIRNLYPKTYEDKKVHGGQNMKNRSDKRQMTERQIFWSSAKPRDQNRDFYKKSNYPRREKHNEKER